MGSKHDDIKITVENPLATNSLTIIAHPTKRTSKKVVCLSVIGALALAVGGAGGAIYWYSRPPGTTGNTSPIDISNVADGDSAAALSPRYGALDVIKIEKGDLCYTIAKEYGISLSTFLSFNKGLDCDNLQHGQKVKVPRKVRKTVTVKEGDLCYTIAIDYKLTVDELTALNPGLDCSNLQVGQVLNVEDGQSILPTKVIPTTSSTKAPVTTVAPTTKAAEAVYYTIKSDSDLCYNIADRFGITLNMLLQLNPGLDCMTLQIGQRLKVKDGSSGGGPNPPAPTTKAAEAVYYTIKSDSDLCYNIADRFDITLNMLLQLNPGLDCMTLQIGQRLKVKDGSSGGGPNPPAPTAPAGNDKVTWSMFSRAFTDNGYAKPSVEQYNNFVAGYTKYGGITDLREVAMILAHLMHESGGLLVKREEQCIKSGCPGDYRSPGDAAGKYYYGRGYIQLTWSYNYRSASRELYGDDRLVQNPDLVASDDKVSWATTFWFWKNQVHSDKRVREGWFGASTYRINGVLECPCQRACPTRFKYYKKVLAIMDPSATPDGRGC